MRLNPERRELATDELTEGDLDAVGGGAACSPCTFFNWGADASYLDLGPPVLGHEPTHARH